MWGQTLGTQGPRREKGVVGPSQLCGEWKVPPRNKLLFFLVVVQSLPWGRADKLSDRSWEARQWRCRCGQASPGPGRAICVSLSFRDCPGGAELTSHVALLPKVIRVVPEQRVMMLKEGSSCCVNTFAVYFWASNQAFLSHILTQVTSFTINLLY